MSKRGFLFSSLDGKRQRRKLSVGPRSSDRPAYNDQPDSPDICSSSQSFKFPATGDIFFHFLDRLMDQVVMLRASKNPPQVFLNASPVLTGASSLRSPHQSSLNTGFDFCGFTDSTDSPMLGSLANQNQPTPLSLDSSPTTSSISTGVTRNAVISTSATPEVSSGWVPAARPVALQPCNVPDSLSVAAPAVLPLLSASAMPNVSVPKAVYRPPHLRAAAQATRSTHEPSPAVAASALALSAESSATFFPPISATVLSLPAEAVRLPPPPRLPSLITPSMHLSTAQPKSAPSSRLPSPSVSPSPTTTTPITSSAKDSASSALSSPSSLLSENSLSLKFSLGIPDSPLHSLPVPSLPHHSLVSTINTDASIKRTVLSSISEGHHRHHNHHHHRPPRRNSRGWASGSTSVSSRSSLRASAPPFVPLAAKGMSQAQA